MIAARAADDPSSTAVTGVRSTVTLIAVLGALTAVAPLAIDMYVPGFPELGRSLDAGDSAVQLSMTAFLAGLVIGQLVAGPLSDGLGRRRLLVPGLILFAALSVACAAAPNIQLFVAGRFLQGAAGGVGTVLARAVLTDRFRGPRLPGYFSLLAMVMGIAPVVAPVVGGAVLAVASWRAVFGVLAVLGALLLAGVLVWVPESLPPERRSPGGLGQALRSMGRLLGHRPFLGYVLTQSFCGAALFGYIAGSSFVFQDVYGASTTRYSLVFATNAVGMVCAGAAFGALSRGLAVNTLLSVAVGTATVGAVCLAVLIAADGGGLGATWACLFVTAVGIGGTFPATTSLGQVLGADASGAASALMGGGQFLLGAVAAPLAGAFGDDTAAPMAAIVLTGTVGAALALVLLARPWQGHGESRPVARSAAAPAASGAPAP